MIPSSDKYHASSLKTLGWADALEYLLNTFLSHRSGYRNNVCKYTALQSFAHAKSLAKELDDNKSKESRDAVSELDQSANLASLLEGFLIAD